MNAITIHQPWAWLISVDRVPMRPGFDQLAPKRIENRTWRPYRFSVGQELAIHAGKTIDKESVGILDAIGVDVPEKWVTMAVLAVATLDGSSSSIPDPGSDQETWYCGPIVWILRDVERLPSPVFTPGKQGIWKLSGMTLETLNFLRSEGGRHPDGSAVLVPIPEAS